MKFSLTISFLTLFFTSVLVKAQDPKAIRKEWESRLKKLDAMQYKALVEENEKLKANEAARAASIEETQNLLTQKDETIARLNKKIDSLVNIINQLNQEHQSYKNSVSSAIAPQKNTVDITQNNPKTQEVLYKGGIIFKVQIGAFKNKDLTKYFDNNKNFSGEIDHDGVKKYTLGYFNDYWEAENFKKYMREMGVKDAWIVAYKNGVRVNIRDVLEGLL
jgi:hypothetical protein